MRAQHSATIDRAAFVAAIKRLPTREGPLRVPGARSAMPRDVLIYSDGAALVIEGPSVAIPFPMQGNWDVRISVKARTLAIIGANIKPGATIELTFVAGSLVLDSGAFVVPAVALGQ